MTEEINDFDAWLDDYQPYISSAKVCGRADLIHQHAQADLALHEARANAGDSLASNEVNEALRTVKALEAKIAESERTFTFQGIGNVPFQDLKRKHPPRDVDRENGADCNMDEFAPALIAACSLNPKLTRGQAERMMARFAVSEFQKVFDAALEANGEVIGPPKSGAAALTELWRQNAASSTTALPEESPDPSSSVDDDVLSTKPSETPKDN